MTPPTVPAPRGSSAGGPPCTREQLQGVDAFAALPLGAIRPRGWLRRQLVENLAGFTGHLEQLAPDLFADQLYGRDRLTPAVTGKQLGALDVPAEAQPQLLWWNSETQGNAWDGYLRTAVLLGDRAALARCEAQVAALLATQDADGYLGIYASGLRYQFHGENGELWAKATCCRYLLGWYEYTGAPAVLAAVVGAMAELMRAYPIDRSHPFRSDSPHPGGLTHGLMITDVLAHLHRLTGERQYADYLVFLYRDFSAQPLDEDAQLAKLLDPARPLAGHGVHAYEHLRAVAAAWAASGDPEIGAALGAFLRKVARQVLPSGGPVGDEFIAGPPPDPTTRGYEYCSLAELLHSYADLLRLTGGREHGDAIERLFFNAAQGARLPGGRAIAYLKSDNSYAMTGPLNGDPATPRQCRYQYSPVHRDAAVCCVPNAGRIGPYFVSHAWMRAGDTLVATLLGPCEVRTDIAGRTVRVVEETEYPFGDAVCFRISGAADGLLLRVRRPEWAEQLVASLPYTEERGFLEFAIPAGAAEQALTIEFAPEPCRHATPAGEAYFTRGALVLCHPIAAREETGRTYPVDGFRDLTYTALDPRRYACPADPRIRPAGEPRCFTADLVNAATGQREPVTLQPMAGTVLRQVTFPAPKRGEAAADPGRGVTGLPANASSPCMP